MRINKEGKSAQELGRVRALRHYYRKRTELRNILGGKCVICGSDSNLEFHHKDPNIKEFDITRRYTQPTAKLLTELQKCELRCEECHKRIHRLLGIANASN